MFGFFEFAAKVVVLFKDSAVFIHKANVRTSDVNPVEKTEVYIN